MRGASNGRATGEDAGYLRLAALAIRTGADVQLLSSQLSVHPSHGERLIKVLGHERHEICEPE